MHWWYVSWGSWWIQQVCQSSWCILWREHVCNFSIQWTELVDRKIRSFRWFWLVSGLVHQQNTQLYRYCHLKLLTETIIVYSKMFVSCRNTEGIDSNYEYCNSFGNFIYLFCSSWTQPRQGGQNSICSFQPNFISLVSSAGCTSTIYSLEKERHHGTEQYKYQISIDHYWRKQRQVQLWSEETGWSWQGRNPSCHWKWVFFHKKIKWNKF